MFCTAIKFFIFFPCFCLKNYRNPLDSMYSFRNSIYGHKCIEHLANFCQNSYPHKWYKHFPREHRHCILTAVEIRLRNRCCLSLSFSVVLCISFFLILWFFPYLLVPSFLKLHVYELKKIFFFLVLIIFFVLKFFLLFYAFPFVIAVIFLVLLGVSIICSVVFFV